MITKSKKPPTECLVKSQNSANRLGRQQRGDSTSCGRKPIRSSTPRLGSGVLALPCGCAKNWRTPTSGGQCNQSVPIVRRVNLTQTNPRSMLFQNAPKGHFHNEKLQNHLNKWNRETRFWGRFTSDSPVTPLLFMGAPADCHCCFHCIAGICECG